MGYPEFLNPNNPNLFASFSKIFPSKQTPFSLPTSGTGQAAKEAADGDFEVGERWAIVSSFENYLDLNANDTGMYIYNIYTYIYIHTYIHIYIYIHIMILHVRGKVYR